MSTKELYNKQPLDVASETQETWALVRSIRLYGGLGWDGLG